MKVSKQTFHDFSPQSRLLPIKSVLFFDQSEVNNSSNEAASIFPRIATAAPYARRLWLASDLFSLFLVASRGHWINLMFFSLSLGTH